MKIVSRAGRSSAAPASRISRRRAAWEREQEIETRVSEAARILVEHAPQVLDGDVAVFHRR
jgi:hypothetical protein